MHTKTILAKFFILTLAIGINYWIDTVLFNNRFSTETVILPVIILLPLLIWGKFPRKQKK